MIRASIKTLRLFFMLFLWDSAINVRVRLYADYDDLFQLGWDLNRRLKPALDAAKIEIPFLSGWFIMSIKLIKSPSQLYHHAAKDS